MIWVQWALLYLTDQDAVAFFQRCKTGLAPGGIIVVKENICAKGFVVDKVGPCSIRALNVVHTC